MATFFRSILAGVFLTTMLGSCAAIFFGGKPDDSNQAVFDHFCHLIETRYSLFDLKEVDWPKSKAIYQSQIRDSMSKEELLEVLGGLLTTLKDGHVNITTDWNYARHWDWYLDYAQNFNFEIVERNYLGKDHWRTGPFLNSIIDSIGYVYYGSFATPISGRSLQALMERMKSCRGVILDLRNNGGGRLNNTRLIAQRFADTTRQALTFYYKSGPAREQFDGPFSYTIKPSGKFQFTKPVVILVNRKSYSAATFFPAIMSAFPHVCIMGDQTGGGGGIPYHFDLPNGWDFRLSTTKTIDSKGRNIEAGIPPDVAASLQPSDEKQGKDTMIEQALEFIRTKSISR